MYSKNLGPLSFYSEPLEAFGPEIKATGKALKDAKEQADTTVSLKISLLNIAKNVRTMFTNSFG